MIIGGKAGRGIDTKSWGSPLCPYTSVQKLLLTVVVCRTHVTYEALKRLATSDNSPLFFFFSAMLINLRDCVDYFFTDYFIFYVRL